VSFSICSPRTSLPWSRSGSIGRLRRKRGCVRLFGVRSNTALHQTAARVDSSPGRHAPSPSLVATPCPDPRLSPVNFAIAEFFYEPRTARCALHERATPPRQLTGLGTIGWCQFWCQLGSGFGALPCAVLQPAHSWNHYKQGPTSPSCALLHLGAIGPGRITNAVLCQLS